MYKELCSFSSNYEDEIRALGEPAKMAGMTQVVQFPYSLPVRDLAMAGSMLMRLAGRGREKRSGACGCSGSEKGARQAVTRNANQTAGGKGRSPAFLAKPSSSLQVNLPSSKYTEHSFPNGLPSKRQTFSSNCRR